VTTVDPSHGPVSETLATLSGLSADRAGIDTFSRYLWQAKQVVRLWLTCLSEAEGPVCVICEHIDDTLVVYPDHIRFMQFKTRDKGSWSAKRMSREGNGIDTLGRSYQAARSVGLHTSATFELWFEGPISEEKETGAFVARPAGADAALQKRIIGLGMRKEWLSDFLDRLIIRPGQPSRSHIDALAIKELGALWPHLAMADLENLYDSLLSSATAAQGGERQPVAVRMCLAGAVPAIRATQPDGKQQQEMADILPQVLRNDQLRALTPPLPDESVESLLARIAEGSTMSALELKLRSAGASEATIDEVKTLRAASEIKRQECLASSRHAEVELEELADRILIVARAEARKAGLSGGLAAAARPAEFITAGLLSDPARLSALDERSLFGRDWRQIFGYLGQLSDECRFPWRAA
jgi:hypothetical protein